MQSDIPVDNNKKIWKMKIPLKTKKFGWYLHRGVILTKDNLARRNWHGSMRCVFCHRTRLLNTYSSNAALLDLYGQSSKQPPASTHRLVLPMYLEIGFMVSILGLEHLLGWER
jgi:hypothetical protein